MAVLKYYDSTTSKWVPVGGMGGGSTPSPTPASAAQIKTKKVSSLPTVGDEDTIYLVPSVDAGGNDNSEEYIYSGSTWERLGTRDASSEMSATTTDIDGIF